MLKSGFSLRTVLIILAGLFLITACSSQPRQGSAIDEAVKEQVRELLAKGQASESPERDRHFLHAAALLAEAGETLGAQNLLASIDSDALGTNDFIHYVLVYSQVATADDSYFLAQRILTSPRLEQQWDTLPLGSAKTLRQRRAELYELLGEPINSVVERIALARLLGDEEEQQDNQDAIWRGLMAVSEVELQALQESRDSAIRDNEVLQGWVELAILSQHNVLDLERQLATLEGWMARRPSHPASLRLPTDLQLLQQLVEQQPRQVALLLPLNGDYERAGKAIRDGFMAAYYDARQRGSYTPQVRIFDTNQDDINAVYDLAIEDGAEVVIGPLRPEDLSELQLRPFLPVPTLALNYTPSPFGLLPSQLYQFSFEVEDEARQVAQRAWLEGHRYALVLVPQTQRGERQAVAFREAWEALGGRIVRQSYYADQRDYSSVVESALLVDQSKARSRQLRQLLGGDIKFEMPRRRQDVDFVFLVADPEPAQLLKPTLAFHYAGSLPVYSTSSVVATDSKLSASRDLNGIRFVTLPWHFDEENPVKQMIDQYSRPNASYIRLYAMGVDAYRLYPRLPQLDQVPGTRFYGQTGVLSLTAERKLQREQVWAQVRNGSITALPTAVSEADTP